MGEPKKKASRKQRGHVPRAKLFLERLLYAINETCERIGWEWSVERKTISFCKSVAWLPTSKGDGFKISVEIYFDLETKGRMFRYVIVDGFFTPAYLKASNRIEAEAFLDALVEKIVAQTHRWVKEHPEDSQRIDYLLDRTKNDKPAPKRTPDVVKQTNEVKQALNRELDRESRRAVVRKANELRLADPKRQWKEIAKELDLPERTLREWRHNPHYQIKREAANSGE